MAIPAAGAARIQYFSQTDDTESRDYILILSSQTMADEVRVLDANDPTGAFRIIQPRERGLEYSVDHYGDHFYIRTNLDAQNFRLMRTPVDATAKTSWVTPLSPSSTLTSLAMIMGAPV